MPAARQAVLVLGRPARLPQGVERNLRGRFARQARLAQTAGPARPVEGGGDQHRNRPDVPKAMTEQDVAWLLANWQAILGVVVGLCLVAFFLLLTVVFWTIAG